MVKTDKISLALPQCWGEWSRPLATISRTLPSLLHPHLCNSEHSYIKYSVKYKDGVTRQRGFPYKDRGVESTPPPPVLSLFSKNLQTTHTWNFLTFPNFWLQIPNEFFSRKVLFTPSERTFGTPSTKLFFY